MPLPRKFKSLLELSSEQVEKPSYAWLAYAVCACEEDACGWQGWLLESAFMQQEGEDDLLLPVDSSLECPECHRPLYCTVTYRVEPSADQRPRLIPGVDYEETPIEYHGEVGPDIPVTPPTPRGAGVWREVDPATEQGHGTIR